MRAPTVFQAFLQKPRPPHVCLGLEFLLFLFPDTPRSSPPDFCFFCKVWEFFSEFCRVTFKAFDSGHGATLHRNLAIVPVFSSPYFFRPTPAGRDCNVFFFTYPPHVSFTRAYIRFPQCLPFGLRKGI